MTDSGYVDVNGGRIFYTRDGAGQPVVLIHGGLVDLRMFDGQVNALSQRHTLVRIDLRGYGRSSMPPSTSYRHCDDVAAVLDIDVVYVHSWNGFRELFGEDVEQVQDQSTQLSGCGSRPCRDAPGCLNQS